MKTENSVGSKDIKELCKDATKNVYVSKNYVNQKYGDYRNSISTTPSGMAATQQSFGNPLNLGTSSSNGSQMNQILSPKYISTKPGLIKSSKYATNNFKTEQSSS